MLILSRIIMKDDSILSPLMIALKHNTLDILARTDTFIDFIIDEMSGDDKHYRMISLEEEEGAVSRR